MDTNDSSIPVTNGHTNGQQLDWAWVDFLPNPQVGRTLKGVQAPANVAPVGTVLTQRFVSEFIGRRNDGASCKLVFPQNIHMEKAIRDMRETKPAGPWKLPVFFRESEKVIFAVMVNDKELDKDQGPRLEQLPPELLLRQVSLEKVVADLRQKFERTIRPSVHQRLLVIIDYQNFATSFAEFNNRADPKRISLCIDEIVELARCYNTPETREVVGVLIFDFNDPDYMDLYETYRNRDFKFIPVQPVPGENPTDQVLIDQTIAFLDKEGHTIDVACLLSGDGDFVPLLRVLKSRNIQVHVAAFPPNLSRELFIEANRFINLASFFRQYADLGVC